MLLQGDLPWGGYPIQEETKMEKINLKNGNIIAIQADVDPYQLQKMTSTVLVIGLILFLAMALLIVKKKSLKKTIKMS